MTGLAALLALVAGAGLTACASAGGSGPASSTVAGTTTTPAGQCAPPPAPHCASPAEVGRFVSLADAGLKLDYVATYRYLGAKGLPATFVYAKTSARSHLGTAFSYTAVAAGTMFRAIESSSGFYECTRDVLPTPWTCYGPNPSEGTAGLSEQLSYDVAPDYISLFQPPVNGSVLFSRTVAGYPSTCLTYTFTLPNSRSTWCITSSGVLDYFAGLSLFHPIELVSLSMTPGPDLVAVPAKAGPWVQLEQQDVAFSPPGWAL